jgi:arginyl-tRNA synthetase
MKKGRIVFANACERKDNVASAALGIESLLGSGYFSFPMNEQDSNAKLIGAMLSEWMGEVFRAAFPDAESNFSDMEVVPTANPDFGDYQCNAAMGLAKGLRQAPRQIAEKVVSSVSPSDLVERMEVAGPGFINLWLKDAWLADYVGRMGDAPHLFVPEVGGKRTVILDYGSPNMTKPLHIGHLRSHNIGNALDRLHRYLGYHVIADNHLGDWGTQFGITIMGYRHFGNPEAMEAAPLEELERVYVESYKRGETDEDWKDQCRQELVKLQAGDSGNRALWEQFIALSLEEIERLYARLGVSYDLVRGESYYHDALAGVVDRLTDEGLAVLSEGAMVVFLEDEGLPVCIVRKRDGGFNYATTDIATVESRIQEFAPERIVYVTDERQQDHFRQFFTICRKMGHTTELVHVWFGLMRMPEKVIATREGNAEERAFAIVSESNPDMDEEERREVARIVGIGAVKYADLSQNPQSLVTFTWDKALALDGNSGPYLQYACARIASVRRKYHEMFDGRDPDGEAIQLGESVERRLALKLIRFPEAVLRAAEDYRPSVVTEYLFDLAQAYSGFYQNVPFLKAEEGARESRVRLCGVVERVLKQGLDLLGIETPERI